MPISESHNIEHAYMDWIFCEKRSYTYTHPVFDFK